MTSDSAIARTQSDSTFIRLESDCRGHIHCLLHADDAVFTSATISLSFTSCPSLRLCISLPLCLILCSGLRISHRQPQHSPTASRHLSFLIPICSFIQAISIASLRDHYYSGALPTQQWYWAGFEPTTLRTKGDESTNEPPRPTV